MIIFSPSLPHRVISAGNKSWHRRSLGYYCAPEWWSPGTFLCSYFFLPSSVVLRAPCAKEPKSFSRWEFMQLNFALLCPQSQQRKVGDSRQCFRACFTRIYQELHLGDTRDSSQKLESLDIPCFGWVQWNWALPSSPVHFCCLSHHHLSPHLWFPPCHSAASDMEIYTDLWASKSCNLPALW